ncbi:MAG: hypothetical protein KC636_04855 [Myxococcales bacterium]|nr:hypothetical protein [Myxococcales bacterium]
MKLLEALRGGELGVRLQLPSSLSITRDDEHQAVLGDPERGAEWWLYSQPGLHLDLDPAAEGDLRAAVWHYARFMFDELHAQRGGPELGPRIADPAWSPMIDCERLDLGGAPALRLVHRMIYEQGYEVILGHLLIPRPWGLFEARVVTVDRTTGFRESVAMVMKTQAGLSPEASMKQATQAGYDDPALDAAFPHHCLSRSRAALTWLIGQDGFAVEAAALPRATDVLAVPGFGALRPPPRFYEASPALLLRTSFCVTDGVERLFVRCEGDAPLAPAALERHAVEVTHAIHAQSQVTELALTSAQHRSRPGHVDTLVIVEGRGHYGRLRNAVYWTLDDAGRPWSLSLTGSAAIPADERAAELVEVARSWRP